MKIKGSKDAAIEFKLADDFGELHSYYVVRHPAGTGWPLGLKLLKVLGPAVGTALDSVHYGNLGEALKSVGEAVQAASEMTINGAELGQTAAKLAGELLDDESLVRQVFEHTARDNTMVRDCFDSAFQGNYGELVMALFQVIKANFGPLFLRFLGRRSTSLESIVGAQSRPMATPTPS